MIFFWTSLLVVCVSFQSAVAIIGGYNTPDEITAFHVSLQKCDDNGDNCVHFCGASLLSEYWLMTTAKCILSVPVDNIKAVIGVIKLSDTSDRRQESTIESHIVHPKYADLGDSSPNDIALVKLAHGTQWSWYAQPASLPSQGQNPYQDDGTVPGWGDTTGEDNNSVGKDHLQVMDVYLAPLQDCIDQIDEVYPNNNITLYPDVHLCTKWLNGIEIASACSGDMGGALMQNGPDLIGIVSWSIHPCKTGAPTVYTNLSNYANWIRKHINDSIS